MMGKGKKGKKVSTGKKALRNVVYGASLIGGAGYGLRKYTNANPTGRIAAAKNAASDLAARMGAGFSSKMSNAKAGLSAMSRGRKIAAAAGGVALLGASGLGAAYFANSKKSRKARNIKVS